MKGLPKNLPELENPALFVSNQGNKITISMTIDVFNPPPGFMIHMDFAFFNVGSIYRFLQMFWLCVMLLHTPLDFHPEEINCHLKLLKSLSLNLGIRIGNLHESKCMNMVH